VVSGRHVYGPQCKIKNKNYLYIKSSLGSFFYTLIRIIVHNFLNDYVKYDIIQNVTIILLPLKIKIFGGTVLRVLQGGKLSYEPQKS